MTELESATHRTLGGSERPLTVSVRSGASVSMPGMMNTILNLGLTINATRGLTAETGNSSFAWKSRLRFMSSFASAITDIDAAGLEAVAAEDAPRQLELAVAAVCSSWDTPRAATYRALHNIPDDLGTAVTVQAMVYGNRDRHSGTGVAFSRDPNTGEPVPFGEVLCGGQGDDVVSGKSPTRPLHELADREPQVWADLVHALTRIENHYRDACHIEFTFEAGALWILQVRTGGLATVAAVRVAVDLAAEGVIERHEALLRISPQHFQHARTPRIATDSGADILARGLGACPGVAAGRIVTTADNAVRMAAAGPVILIRPETSPLDMHGLAAAAGVVTARGGPSCHAAIVARAMSKPAVVGVTDLIVDAASVRCGERTLPEGTLVTIDGTSGAVTIGSPRIATAVPDPYLHQLLEWADKVSGNHSPRNETERLATARVVLLRG
ncbi:PEP/pyruvate-binding domain-containing protein [Nocardia sp. NBC_00403]|uniref:PEP/pyruvate-binding domain-containing protein n=1 Tax=Nocardia sp. NBC_00403 TaxID=2975990 RepID=UPI0030E5330D